MRTQLDDMNCNGMAPHMSAVGSVMPIEGGKGRDASWNFISPLFACLSLSLSLYPCVCCHDAEQQSQKVRVAFGPFSSELLLAQLTLRTFETLNRYRQQQKSDRLTILFIRAAMRKTEKKIGMEQEQLSRKHGVRGEAVPFG